MNPCLRRLLPLLAMPLLGQTPRLVLKPEPAWYLRGGLLTGGFVPPQGRAEWPPWMQALCAQGQASSKELAQADLLKVPDVFLARAVDRLRESGVFTPALLDQVAAIGYVADSKPWTKARLAYLKAYAEAKGLPAEDPGLCGRVLSVLVGEGESATARRALASAPADPALRASWRRMLDLRDRRAAVLPSLVRDPRLPAEERYLAWRRLLPGARFPALADLHGTGFLDEAVHHLVTQEDLSLDSPLVDEAIRAAALPAQEVPAFLARDGERGSDLLWQRASHQLGLGNKANSVKHCEEIIKRFPGSWYAGHAAYLLHGLGMPATPATHRLRIPGDVTLANADRFAAGLRPAENWPEAFAPLAEAGRFDLLLARLDPLRQADLFLRAAHGAGQMDLVARHHALRKGLSLSNLRWLYPVLPLGTVQRLIHEEGGESLLDPAFVLAVIKNESQFQSAATSWARAMGLMQLLPPTFRAMAGRKADIRDPEANIRAGIRYLLRVARTADLHGQPPRVRMAYMVAGYHAGEGRARRWHAEHRGRLDRNADPIAMILRTEAIPIVSTRQYVLRVLGDREIYLKLLKG